MGNQTTSIPAPSAPKRKTRPLIPLFRACLILKHGAKLVHGGDFLELL